MTLFSRSDLARPVRQHRVERGAKGCARWTQFVARLFGPLGRAYSLREICGGLASVEGKRNHFSLEASIRALCLTMKDWAQFRRTQGAVKLHLRLDHDGCLPGYAVLTEGRPHQLRVACALAFPSGALVAMDRGEVEYAFFDSLNERGVVLVPRLQDKALGEVAAVVAEPQGVILPTRGSICRGTGKTSA